METGLLGIGIPEGAPADGSAAGDATPDATSADDSGAEQP
jgi:hypothetical protein